MSKRLPILCFTIKYLESGEKENEDFSDVSRISD